MILAWKKKETQKSKEESMNLVVYSYNRLLLNNEKNLKNTLSNRKQVQEAHRSDDAH